MSDTEFAAFREPERGAAEWEALRERYADELTPGTSESEALWKRVGRLSVGNGGWVRLFETAHDRAAVRFTDRRGRLVATELYLGAPVDATALRRFPVLALERFVNSDPDVASAVRARLNVPGPLLDVAIDFYGTSFGTRNGQPRRPHWAADAFWSQVPNSGVRKATGPEDPAPMEFVDVSIDPKLEVPPSRPFPPEFYSAVAELYQRLVRAGKPPARAIVDANPGVMPTQVHRWIRVARERGLLPKAHQGKAG